MSKAVGLAIVAAGVALAVVIGQRMSTDAMAVVVGVAVGVMASIPTSLLVMAAMRRAQPGYTRPERDERPSVAPPPAQPQIYIVNPGAGPGQPAAPWLTGGVQAQLPPPAGYPWTPETNRRYKVVGQDERWLDEDYDG